MSTLQTFRPACTRCAACVVCSRYCFEAHARREEGPLSGAEDADVDAADFQACLYGVRCLPCLGSAATHISSLPAKVCCLCGGLQDSMLSSMHAAAAHQAVPSSPRCSQLPVQVDITHCGVYHFKGVPDLQTVMQLSTRRLSGRTFPSNPPSGKTRVMAAARGLQVS